MKQFQIISLLLLLFVPLLVFGSELTNPLYNGKVFQGTDGRLEAYMIPPFETNHASFIERIHGAFLLAWFSGVAEGQNLTSIVLSILHDGSDQWSSPVVLSKRSGYSNQNPVLYFNLLTNITHLYHSQQPAGKTFALSPMGEGNEEYATVWELQSSDSGNRWTEPREVFSTPGSYDRNRMALIDNNETWLFPMYSAHGTDEEEHSYISVSKDFGDSWDQTLFPNSNWLVQPNIVRVSNDPTTNEFRAFFRDRRAEWIYTAYSSDDGKSWTDPVRTKLPNNNAAIQAFHLLSNRIAIVFNNSTKERTPLCVALSEDGGNTWPYSRGLEPENPSSFATRDDVEYSYPSIVQTVDQKIHISYTYNRDTIKYVQVNEEWIMQSHSCSA